jgi:hypothetical protein
MTGLFRRLQDEIEARAQNKGLSPIDLLDMPEALATVINKVIRSNGMKLEDIATELGQSVEETQTTLDELVKKNLVRRVEVKDEIWYKAQFARKSDKTLSSNIWAALDGVVDDSAEK